jgi:hypothetical protein
MSWKWLAVKDTYGMFLGNRVWDTIELLVKRFRNSLCGDGVIQPLLPPLFPLSESR